MTTEELYALYLKHPHICTDSRDVRPGSIFFALRGERFDGNTYAATALSKGCAYAVIDHRAQVAGKEYILVEDSLRSLQELAARHRSKLAVPVIAITGSNGKTTTKELLRAVLSRKYPVTATGGNLNNHIGVPLTLLSVPVKAEMVMVEMGASHTGEIRELCRIVQPDHGIITNIGKAHLEGFGSPEGVAEAKKELYEHLRKTKGIAFVNADDALLTGLSEGMDTVTYGVSGGRIRGRMTGEAPHIVLEWHDTEHSGAAMKHTVRTQLTGAYNLANALAAIAAGHHFGISPDQIAGAIEAYVPENNRSQIIHTGSNTVLLDAYNANPTSVEAALDAFRRFPGKKKAVILGDMLELGAYSAPEHRRIAGLLRAMQLDWVLLAGSAFFRLKEDYPYTFAETASGALEWLKSKKVKNTSVLIKGSRKLALEQLAGAL